MDNIFANLFRFRQTREVQPVPGVPATTDPNHPSNQPKATGGSFEERIVYVQSPQVALTVSPVFRALKLIMDTHGVMPVQYRKKDTIGGNFTEDMRGLGKRINYLLQVEPNPITTAADLWKQVTYNQHMRGNGFVYIERDEFGFPYRLWLCRMGEYNIMTGRYNFIMYLSDEGYVEKTNVPRSDVMHFPNTYRYQNGFWGMSTLEFAKGELGLIKTNKQQSLETAAKGGRVKGFISEEQPASGQGTLAFGMFNKDSMQDYAKEINDDTYHEHSTYFNADVDNVHIDADLDKLEAEYEEMHERTLYHGKFKPGDKVRMLTLDEMLNMDGVEMQRNEFGTNMIKNTKFHAPLWTCLVDQVTEQMGKSFTVEKILGDCVFTPNGYFFQEWMFVKQEE